MENGKVKKSKLEKKNIYREQVKDRVFSCAFTAPDVHTGSVVEVSYSITSPFSIDIPTLKLQQEIPVNQVHASFTHPDFISVKKMTQGYIHPKYSQEAIPRHSEINILSSYTEYTDNYDLVDVPALHDETMSMCPSQYSTHIKYSLSQIVIPGYIYETLSKNWPDIDRIFRESNVVKECKVTGKVINQFKSENTDELAAIIEVRNKVTDVVKYNGTDNLFPNEVKATVKEGAGSSASINAIVASTLNAMGYQVSPVLLRKRTQGLLGSSFVRPDAFSIMILQIVTPSGEVHYLDAADQNGYLDVFDPNFLVTEARVIPCETGIPPTWVDLSTLAKGNMGMVVNAHLDDDDVVRGELSVSGSGEDSYMIKRTRNRKDSDEEYVQSVAEGENFEPVDFELGEKEYSPQVTHKIQFEQEATTGGDFIYISPFLIKHHHESDFPEQERHIPVDFHFCESVSYRYMLTIPEGYEVAEVPATVALRSEPLQGRLLCQTKILNGAVIMQFTYKNEALLATPDQYDDIRAFWQAICNTYNGRIVLKKAQ